MHLGQPGFGGVPVQLELEALPLPDLADTLEAEPGQGTLDRLALGIEDLGLRHDVDDDTGHGRPLSLGWTGRQSNEGGLPSDGGRVLLGRRVAAGLRRSAVASKDDDPEGDAEPGEGGTEISLEQPGPPLHDEATAAQLRELVTKGAMNGLVFQVDDTRALFEAIKERGVTDFTQEPTDHFYGTDMGIRDPFGNHVRIAQLPG